MGNLLPLTTFIISWEIILGTDHPRFDINQETAVRCKQTADTSNRVESSSPCEGPDFPNLLSRCLNVIDTRQMG
jgi:hypothetical protein